MKGHKGNHHRASGGDVERDEESDYKESDGSKKAKGYDAQGSNVEKEADERKSGGACMPKRKHGGRVKEQHRVEGKMAKMNLSRPGRKSGGRVGSDKSPLSSAAIVAQPKGHHTND
jgi:hypothetical protein